MNFWARTVAGDAARAAIGRHRASAAENVNNTSSTRRRDSIRWTPWRNADRRRRRSELGKRNCRTWTGIWQPAAGLSLDEAEVGIPWQMISKSVTVLSRD